MPGAYCFDLDRTIDRCLQFDHRRWSHDGGRPRADISGPIAKLAAFGQDGSPDTVVTVRGILSLCHQGASTGNSAALNKTPTIQ